MPSVAERRAKVKAVLDTDLTEVRCRSCGTYLGVRRRSGTFLFWCSEDCATTLMAKFDKDQIRDEMAVELYLSGVSLVDIAKFTESPHYTRIQQVLWRRGIDLVGRREIPEQNTA